VLCESVMACLHGKAHRLLYEVEQVWLVTTAEQIRLVRVTASHSLSTLKHSSSLTVDRHLGLYLIHVVP